MNRFPVRPNCRVGAAISVDNRRLFLNGLELGTKPDKIAEILQCNGIFGLTLIEVHSKLNKAFALIEFENHTAASQARRILVPDCCNIFNKQVTVEWADPKFPSQDELKTVVIFKITFIFSLYQMLNEYDVMIQIYFRERLYM